MLKLTYIHGSPIRAGAANGVHVIRMCAAFARQGVSVTLLVPATRDGIPKHALADHFGTDVLGFDVLEVATVRRGRALHYPLRAAAASRRLGSDLVYTRAVLPAAATSLAGIETVFEAHVPVHATGGLARSAFALARRSRNFRGVVAISHALAAALTADHPDLQGRILVAPDGADLPPLRPPDKEPATRYPDTAGVAQAVSLRVGYVGQLYPGKGMEVIVPLAASRLHHEFHVVGGPASLVAEWTRRSIPVNLLLHGEVPPGGVARITSGFDVLLAPYQRTVAGRNGMDIARWMSPLKIFEYMAARRPMIASNLPVLREVLEDGRNALLCEPEDIAGWAAALDRLAADGALRRRLRDAAWTDVTTRYTWDQRARSLLRFAGAQP